MHLTSFTPLPDLLPTLTFDSLYGSVVFDEYGYLTVDAHATVYDFAPFGEVVIFKSLEGRVYTMVHFGQQERLRPVCLSAAPSQCAERTSSFFLRRSSHLRSQTPT